MELDVYISTSCSAVLKQHQAWYFHGFHIWKSKTLVVGLNIPKTKTKKLTNPSLITQELSLGRKHRFISQASEVKSLMIANRHNNAKLFFLITVICIILLNHCQKEPRRKLLGDTRLKIESTLFKMTQSSPAKSGDWFEFINPKTRPSFFRRILPNIILSYY